MGEIINLTNKRINANCISLDKAPLTDYIRRFIFSSASPIHLEAQRTEGGYSSFIVGGFVQNIGGVLLSIINNGGTLNIKNLATMSDFSNAHLTITANGLGIDISSDTAQNSILTTITF